MSLMDITCGDCGAHYRLDVALLKGEKGARIRCRKCGGRIVVRLPEESPVPSPPVPAAREVVPKEDSASAPRTGQEEISPPPAEESPAPEKPPEKSAPWQEEAALPPAVEAEAPAQKPTAFEADISDVITSEPVPSPPEEKAVHRDNLWIDSGPETAWPRTDTGRQEIHDPGGADPFPSGKPGTIYSGMEDIFADPPGETAGPDRIPPPPEEYPAGENPPEETPATEPERKAPPRRAPSMLAVLVISVLWILLLAGGALYFGTTKSGQDLLGKLFAGWGSGRTGSAPARPVYDIRDVKWHVDNDATAGNLFVIRGSVANVGNVPSAGIRIQVTLLGKDNAALGEKAAFAGNLLDEASLRRADRAGIEGVLSNRFGEGNVNRAIPKDKAVPFMVVFIDPAGTVETFMVRAIDAQ